MKILKNIYSHIEDFIDVTLLQRRWQPMYWLRCHTINRFHIINISGQDDYKWGWLDSDSKMELACYAVLVDFVEKEYPGYVDWDHNAKIRKVRDEILAIYEWWTKGKKLEEAAVHALFEESDWSYSTEEIDSTKSLPKEQKLYSLKSATKHPEKYEEYKKRSAALDIKKEKMLLRLIKVRKHMWT